jgi:hypothetical protein
MDEQPGQKIGLELKDHPEFTIDEDVIDIIDKVFSDLKAMIVKFSALQMHLLSALRVLRSKQHNMLVWGCCQLGTPSYHNFVPICSS